MLLQKILKVMIIFIGLIASIPQADEKIFYPSSIKELEKEEGKNSPSCHNVQISDSTIKQMDTGKDGSKGEITIVNDVKLTKEDKQLLQSNWSGSLIFSDQELEQIKKIMDK